MKEIETNIEDRFENALDPLGINLFDCSINLEKTRSFFYFWFYLIQLLVRFETVFILSVKHWQIEFRPIRIRIIYQQFFASLSYIDILI